MRRSFFFSLALVMIMAVSAWGANIPGKVFESGKDNTPIAVAGMKVEAFGGGGFKVLLSATETDSNGRCLLRNIPLGKEVLVRLTKSGYVTQYDIRSYSDKDVENGAIFWAGSEANIKKMYENLGLTFEPSKGHVYLDINNEFTGEGIEGVEISPSSGKAFDLGGGEYLIANAAGGSVKVELAKPGYAFDIESATIPLFAGAMTQYYISVQTGGFMGTLYQSGQVVRVTSAEITGFIKRLSDAVPISGVSVAFTNWKGETVQPGVVTDETGFYRQDGFKVPSLVKVTPSKSPWRFRPASRWAIVLPRGARIDFNAY